MTRAEVLAYNRGVEDVLAIAARTAHAISSTSRRPAEAFAIEALAELAEAGRALLLPVVDESTASTSRPGNSP